MATLLYPIFWMLFLYSGEIIGTNTCPELHFQCTNKQCIPLTWMCDEIDDCGDNSDEDDEFCDSTDRPTSTVSSFRHNPSSGIRTCSESQFQCTNKKCIPLIWKCDKENDCGDGSDEDDELCGRVTCSPDQFQCKDHHCIPRSLKCNGHKECQDGSDEEHCPDENQCLNNTGGCAQLCINKSVGYSCECYKGYQLIDNETCEDINECEIPGSCSQICTNTEGGFKCDCREGYRLELNSNHRCKAEGHPFLLFAIRRYIKIINLQTHEYEIITNFRNAISLDYQFSTETLVWSDTENCIKKAPITGDPIENIVDSDIIAPEGIAVDWIYDNVYWTDSVKETISVSSLHGRNRKTLISTEMDRPRSIVLNPLQGWMFWTDWGKPAKIERAGMDGSHRKTIISTDIIWPNGLAIDMDINRLFWVDAKLHSLSSAEYDGSNRRVVISSTFTLKHPFAIDVFEDWVYLTEWESKTIYKMNKFTGEELNNVTVRQSLRPMDICIYHSYKQPEGINYCKIMNGMCSHLCLPAPLLTNNSSKFSCACPDNMTLTNDKRTCMDQEDTQV